MEGAGHPTAPAAKDQSRRRPNRSGGAMMRRVLDFHPDGPDAWVAELACAHTRVLPVRGPRAIGWARSPEGRHAQVGRLLECPRCDG